MEKLRGVGGVLVHQVAESWGALCGYHPALGWAKPEERDGSRLICRACSRLRVEHLSRRPPAGVGEGEG